MESNISFTLKPCLTLIKHFRGFSHVKHEFPVGYIQKKRQIIDSIKKEFPVEEAFTNYLCRKGIKLDHLILLLHYTLASVGNIEELTNLLGIKVDMPAIPKSQVNKTNILNVHTLFDAISKISSEQDQSQEKVEFIDYQIKFIHLQEEISIEDSNKKGNKKETSLDLDIFILGIKSKGKFDPYLGAYLCHQFNTQHNISLFSAILVSIDPKKENQVQTCQLLSEFAVSLLNSNKKFKFDQTNYEKYRKELVFYQQPLNTINKTESYHENLNNLLSDIQDDVCNAIFGLDEESMDLIEKLLISMLGHPEVLIREKAICCLNVLYDGVDWQLRKSFKTKIACVGDSFRIDYVIEADDEDSNIILLVNGFSFSQISNESIVSWHKPTITEYQSHDQDLTAKFICISMDLGEFTKCGYYDWKLIKLQKNGRMKSLYKMVNLDELQSVSSLGSLQNEQKLSSKPIQGRFVVHPDFSRNLQVHEVFVDFQDSAPDATGKMTRKGNFIKVKENIGRYRKSGINCIYLMGALERDNGLSIDPKNNQKIFKRPNVSPLAITNRNSPNLMLGGPEKFKEMLSEAQKLDMKIIIDSLTRISSARHHKKYAPQVLHLLDNDGKKIVCYGTDGRSANYEDTALLNYRKKEVWDLFCDEIIAFTEIYHIDGVHLDNCQSWPQIFIPDVEELNRMDSDGTPAYTEQQILDGEVVIQDENCGFWGSSLANKYPNPFLIKLCKKIWKKFPQFLIVGEAWGGPGFEGREISMMNSGPIPRIYNIPIALSTIFGEKLQRDGSITSCERKDVNVFRTWYEYSRKNHPAGSLLIQSTTSHCWPYPALLYKRGTWAAVDVFFFLPDIPLTFIGEQDGHAFRVKTTNIFTKQRILEDKALEKEKLAEESELKKVKSRFSIKNEIKQVKLFDGDITKKPILENKEAGGVIVRVSSGVSISEIASHHLHQAEHNFQKELGPEFGFDLKQIRKHYEHRRYLRMTKEVLRKGKLIPLSAEHDFGWHKHVLCFARIYKNDFAIIAINFNDGPVHAYLNLKNLKFLFEDYEESDMIVKVEDWLTPPESQQQNQYDLFTVAEFINDRHYCLISNFGSVVWGAKVLEPTKELQEKCMEKTVKRLKIKMDNLQAIHANDITTKILNLIKKSNSIQEFVNGFGHVESTILDPYKIAFKKLFGLIKGIRDEPLYAAKLLAIFKIISEKQKDQPEIFKEIPALKEANDFLENNKMGLIAFCCPELGRWSTVGGLGVMVDELSQGLVELGENVIVISPYYNKNRKGVEGYLAEDPEGNFKHTLTMEIWMGGSKYMVGVHEGVVKGVKLAFIHNPEIFPHPYADGDALYTMKQLSLYAKATLEMFCQKREIPNLVVTNDWFSALVPAYAKIKKFGDVYDNTKFFHIVHNLDPLYEGRQYPKKEEGTLNFIHELHDDWLVDPFWSDKVLNPSRCALKTSDNWGTVSPSYKQELLATSPLQGLLGSYPKPFAFPNGIPKELRMKKIKEITGNDHLKSKKMIQQKYFGFGELDNSVTLFAFVGRITEQKGVHLILDSVETLVNKYRGRIQILVGGMANLKDPYGAHCAGLMWSLKNRYPNNFWANPNEFFTDGTLINVGADFGLMPSLFEPGGIVQHEFFIGSTPVIAYKTGGLRDTVFEFDPKTKKGNGFNFQEHRVGELISAIQRAMSCYENQENYKILRQRAFEAAIDVADVARAWDKEFHRMFGKMFIDYDIMEDQYKRIDKTFNQENYKPEDPFVKKKGRLFTEEDERKKNFEKALLHSKQQNLKKVLFKYSTNRLPRPKQIFLIGNFDNWKTKHLLKYDLFSQMWTITIQLSPGEYFYKFIVDGEWVCSEDDAKNNDIFGNINNYIVV